VAPAKAGKSCIVPVRRYPFGARLDSEGGKIGIRNQVAACVRRLAKTGENLPVARPRGNRYAVGALPNLGDKVQGDFQRSRLLENTRMGHDSEETGQGKVGQTITGVSVNNTLQPVAKSFVTRGIDPMGIYQDVNVDENQGRSP